MDSGNASADDDDEESDYESQLYSLVHYSEDTSKVGDVISNSDTLVYVSKRTKVSRLNPVRSIIDTANRSSPFGDKYGQTNQNNKFDTNENNLRNLIYAYKNTASDFSSSTPIRKNCHQNISLVNAFKQNSDPNILRTETSENNYIEIGDQIVSDCINVTALNESVSCDTISYDCNSTRKNNYTGSKSKKINCENYSEHGGSSSKRHLTHDGKVDKNYCIENGHILSESNSQISRRKKNKSHVSEIYVDEDLASSKYNMKLSRGKTNTPLRETDCVASKNATHVKDSKKHGLNESVIVIDDSDSNSSILEMETPVKEPPPVVIVSSEDEDDKAVCKTEIEEDDIIVLYSDGEKSSAVNSNENRQLSKDRHVQKKSKKKKKEKKKKGKKLASFSSQEISPSSWTENMLHFYNDSWGGENFDVKKMQLSMSGKRSKWPVLVTDLDSRMNRQRDIKCQKCNQYGHRARFCSEIQKPVVCLYCGLVGHMQTKCPTAICLRCGKSSLVYNSGCYTCSSNRNNNNQPCSVCKLIGHHATDCPETWRRYHSTTTEEDLSSEKKTVYKPCYQQHCSNCAEKGHQYHECDKSKQQGNWQKRANSSFWAEQRKHAKRRKLEKKNAQNMLHLNNGRNGCPLVPYFVPIYNRYR